eukprot:Hpha_TRINITY_DN3577_c0_g1::TRINITY_DN3577_c0_g1_i1::g.25636::m.25636
MSVGQSSVRWLLNKVTRTYFKRVEVRGKRNLPGGACIIAGNHPSGVIDAMVLMTALPERRISSVAKHSLFSMFPIGFFLKLMEAVPVAKAQDPNLPANKQASPEQRREMNRLMFETVALRLRSGVSICIFPEGTTHSVPEIKDLKTGTARMALEAAASGWRVPIVPVGLSYSEPSGSVFRGSVLVDIGRPIMLTDEIVQQFKESPQGASEASQFVTERIEQYLRHVTIAVPSWEDELERLCQRNGWEAPSYQMVATGQESPILIKLASGETSSRRRRCVVTVNGACFNSHRETPAQAKRRKAKGDAEPPANLIRAAARKAFFHCAGVDGVKMTDEEFVEVVHLMRRLYKPENVELSLTQFAALTRNITYGYLRTKAASDPRVQQMFRDVNEYGRLLASTGINDKYVTSHKVGTDPLRQRLSRLRNLAWRDLLRLSFALPLSAVGTILHAHVGVLSNVAAARFGVTADGDRSVVATVKVIAGFLGCMITWPLVTLGAVEIWGVGAAPFALVGCVASGYVAATEDTLRDLHKANRNVRKLLTDDTVDKMRAQRAELQTRVRELGDLYCEPEHRGWWKSPESFEQALRDKNREWESSLLIVREGDLERSGLSTLRIKLNAGTRHPNEQAVVTYKQHRDNDKALVWIPGRNDSFFHTHVLEEFIAAGFDVFALDLRRCGRAKVAQDGVQLVDPSLAHDSNDFTEYFEEVDALMAFIKSSRPLPTGDWLTPGSGAGKSYHNVVMYAHSTGALVAALYGAPGGGGWRGAIDGYIFNSPFWNWNVSWHQGLAMSVLTTVSQTGVKGLSDDVVLAAGGEKNEYADRLRKHYAIPELLKAGKTLAVSAGWIRAATAVQKKLKKGQLKLGRPILAVFTEADEVLRYKDIDRLNELLCVTNSDGKERPLSSRDLVERSIDSTPADPSGHDVLAAESLLRVKEAMSVITGWLDAHFGIAASAPPNPSRA